MKYKVITPKRFKKDLVRCQKRGLNMRLIHDAIFILQETGTLPQQYHSHKLVNQKHEIWECHIQPDWLMIWEQNDKQLTLLFLQTGTHADLF